MGWFDWLFARRKPKLVVDNESKELTKEDIEEGVISKKVSPALSDIVKEGVENILEKEIEEATVELAKFEEPKRARTSKGTYKADDPTTKDVNEAWVGGRAPKPKKKKVKVKKTSKKK